ncbi:HNH endonuclease [Nannocystaceae bacterium ST9]
MYCEDNMGTDIDHFWPKSKFPERAFSWDNHLLACSHCNSNEKRECFPLGIDGRPLLLDPTAEDPREHLIFIPSNGEFEARGLRGEATIMVFGLNDDSKPRALPLGRRRALNAMMALLRDYDRQAAQQDPEAEITRGNLIAYPFSSVLVWILATAARPNPELVLGADICAILTRHRVADWISDV